MMKITAIILAAGNSSRMNSNSSKLLMDVCSKTVIKRTLENFQNCETIDEIILVSRECDIDSLKKESSEISKVKAIVVGGENRQQSVFNGVSACKHSDFVAIHDGARPFASIDDITRVCEMAINRGAAALAVKVKDTIKETDERNKVVKTPDRSNLWQVQTPQVIDFDTYMKAHEKAEMDGMVFTDDCALVEYFGKEVYMCEGDYKNIKITTPEDIQIAVAFTKREGEAMLRIGHGYDVHRLVEERKLVIGGVEIQHEKGLLGHSDADVLLHAISDAVLGAAALGDIGTVFPDSDPKFCGADSLLLLSEVIKLVSRKGFEIVNIDATVVAQAPKINPFIFKMRENVARVCDILVENVSIKATTEEKLGFTGEKLGISAHSIVLLKKNN